MVRTEKPCFLHGILCFLYGGFLGASEILHFLGGMRYQIYSTGGYSIQWTNSRWIIILVKCYFITSLPIQALTKHGIEMNNYLIECSFKPKVIDCFSMISLHSELYWSQHINSFIPNLKKYILPTFSRDMYK